MGSSHWVDEAIKSGQKVLGLINLDTVGYTSSKNNSQQWPEGIEPDMFEIFGTSDTLTIGDFIAVGDRNSRLLAKTFQEQSELEMINLPYACIQEDFSFEQAAFFMRDIPQNTCNYH